MSREERLPEKNNQQCFINIHKYVDKRIERRIKVHIYALVLFSPGLLNFALRPLTLVVSDVAQGAVDGGEVRFADIEEVRPHSSHRHFGDVGEGLADGAAEDEHAHLLVESRDVRVAHKRLGPLVQKIDPVALPDDDLEGRKRRKCQ